MLIGMKRSMSVIDIYWMISHLAPATISHWIKKLIRCVCNVTYIPEFD